MNNLMVIIPIAFAFSLILVIYFKFIFRSSINKFFKIAIFLIIILADIAILYYIKNSTNKKPLFSFNRLNLHISLDKSSDFLSKERLENGMSEYINFKRDMEKDIFEKSKDIFLKNQVAYNPKGENELTISFIDRAVRKDGILEYYIETSILYSDNEKISTITKINNIDNLKVNDYKKIFTNSLTDLIKAIKYKNTIKNKTSEELIEILSTKKNLPNPFYIQIFSQLLNSEEYPKLPTKIMQKFITNPATFSEASGYAVLSNDCNSVEQIIDNSLIYRKAPLMLLLEILAQSDCKVAKGYLFVLTSSISDDISNLAHQKFDELNKSKKEINYKDGKRVKE